MRAFSVAADAAKAMKLGGSRAVLTEHENQRRHDIDYLTASSAQKEAVAAVPKTHSASTSINITIDCSHRESDMPEMQPTTAVVVGTPMPAISCTCKKPEPE